jgi:hypothetical protein
VFLVVFAPEGSQDLRKIMLSVHLRLVAKGVTRVQVCTLARLLLAISAVDPYFVSSTFTLEPIEVFTKNYELESGADEQSCQTVHT